MTQEELLALQGERNLYRTILSVMNQELKRLKKEIKDTEEKWEVANKKFEEVDRKIAFATKVRVIERKKPENNMSASQAQEMLALLGYSDLTPTNEEEEIENESISCDL